MIILEIDAGNTRIKWRVLDSNTTINSAATFALTDSPALSPEFCEQIEALQQTNISAIRVSNVRGQAFSSELSKFCEKLFAISPEQAVVSAEQFGVKNAYSDASTLGVDRWLAMLAAFQAGQQTGKQGVCVVDCGSAITVDIIDAEGRHQGGYIVPGLHLMQKSLDENTANLPYQPVAGNDMSPGANTTVAINHGVRIMIIGMLEKLYSDWGEGFHWYLCGGDAEYLSSCLGWPHTVKTDLVLDGLVLACSGSESDGRAE